MTGLSLEYQAWNLSGYIFYVVYNIVGYVIQQNDDSMKKTILVSDLCFALHGLIIMGAICYQCYLWAVPGRDTFSKTHLIMLICMWTLGIYNLILAAFGAIEFYSHKNGPYTFSAVHFLGFGKSWVSFIKYLPQVYMNWRRQSTVGFSIHNQLLDFGGGLTAFSQQFIDAYDLSDTNDPDWSVFAGNVPKLVVACESIFFDIIFITQHYILYRGNAAPEADVPPDDDHYILGEDGNDDDLGKKGLVNDTIYNQKKIQSSGSLNSNGDIIPAIMSGSVPKYDGNYHQL